jgi:hypothetical protein
MSKPDPIQSLMEMLDIPLTRENYMAINTMGGDDDLSPEEEAEIPARFQEGTDDAVGVPVETPTVKVFPVKQEKFLVGEEKAADRAIRHNDMYAKMLKRQQKDLPCWFCDSFWGHYGSCPLINGGVKYTAEQLGTLKRMGLQEDEGWTFSPKNKGMPSRHTTWQEFCIYNHKH